MHLSRETFLAAILLLALAQAIRAAEESFESAAKNLSAATVTVRMESSADAEPEDESLLAKRKAGAHGDSQSGASKTFEKQPLDKSEDGKSDEGSSRRGRILLASGVCVGENLIVTALRPKADCAFRVTLPGGMRADAKPCVVDAHSSLVLLELPSDKQDKNAMPPLTPLAIATRPTNLGAKLLAASAWGSEPPTVSQGVLGGVDRFIPSSMLPPLLQCDVHTTATSRGAGVVNAVGELVGVVVAFEGESRRSHWTYLVGGEHVARLLAARKAGEVVELPRRVAHAGLDLRQSAGSDALVVRNVAVGGPAEKAGIRPGDELRSLDGRALHSAFAAARIVASRAPGDKIECVVRRGEAELRLTLALETSTEEPTISFAGKETANEPGNDFGNPHNRAAGDSTAQRRVRPGEARGIPEGPQLLPREVKSPATGTNGKEVADDSLDALRARLRQQEELVKRLEAELRELRRERDRLAGATDQPAVPATEPNAPRK